MEIERWFFFFLISDCAIPPFCGGLLAMSFWEKKIYKRYHIQNTSFFHKNFSSSGRLWCLNFCDKLCCAFPAEGAEGLEQEGCLCFWLPKVLYWSSFNAKYTLKICHLSLLFGKQINLLSITFVHRLTLNKL